MSNPLSHFVKLNADLEKCYGQTSPQDFDKMSKASQDALCADIRNEMQQLMASDSIKLANLLPLRMKSLQ